MLKKYSVLICTLLSILLLIKASLVYPGGTFFDKHTVGFDWTKNFISNLFGAKAMNGMDNPARIWAVIAMAIHSIGDGLFFIHMSKKIPSKHTATVLKTIGAVNILFNFLIATPLHDSMITISSSLSLVALFYITVFILKTRLHLFKVALILCLLTFYYTLYLYGAGDAQQLVIMQKVSMICAMLLVLTLEYFTSAKHFEHLQPEKNKSKKN